MKMVNNIYMGCITNILIFYYQVNIEGRPLNCEIGAKNVFYGYDGERCGVEQLALQYYADGGGGWQGTHSEGGIWMTIFGLLMWDVIFSEVCDVFHSKFQVHDIWTIFSR
jgi:Fanconi-associated nuclease 1